MREPFEGRADAVTSPPNPLRLRLRDDMGRLHDPEARWRFAGLFLGWACALRSLQWVHPARKLTQTSPSRTFVSIEFVSLYIGRHHGYGQHSDEDAKCGRKSCDDSKRGRNLHCHVYLNTADN